MATTKPFSPQDAARFFAKYGVSFNPHDRGSHFLNGIPFSEVDGLVKRIKSLGQTSNAAVTAAMRFSEQHHANFQNPQAAFQMLREATASQGSLKAFLSRSRRFPFDVVMSDRSKHQLFGCSPRQYGHYILHSTLGVPPDSFIDSPHQPKFFTETDIDSSGANPLGGDSDLGNIIHGPIVRSVVKKKTIFVPEERKRLFRTSIKVNVPKEVEEIKKVPMREDPSNPKSARLFAIRLHFQDRRYDHRNGSHTAYTLVLPEPLYHKVLKRLRQKPEDFAQVYQAAYPWHAQGKTFKKVTIRDA